VSKSYSAGLPVTPETTFVNEAITRDTRSFSRRAVLGSLASLAILDCSSAAAQTDDFTSLLAQLTTDPDIVEKSWIYRDPNVTKGVGHGTPSKRKLNKSASDLIISCEISSPAAYESRYRRPIWPRGQSGVTLGVGYDLAFSNRNYIDRDWPHLSKSDRELLAKVTVLRGEKAREALHIVAAVDVPWDQAQEQFFAFLPYPTNDTEHAFPNCDKLPDDSFGALVSLIYNRGPSIDRNSQNRSEMYDIRELMRSKQFGKIPERITHMKRLWTTPDSRGVAIRRDAEAALFARGIQSLKG